MKLFTEVIDRLATALGVVDGCRANVSFGWLAAVLAVMPCVGSEESMCPTICDREVEFVGWFTFDCVVAFLANLLLVCWWLVFLRFLLL